MRPINGTFSARIRHVIGTRKVAPWMARIGVAAGTRARMLKGGGIPPTYETLARMMRIENVSISWLLGADVPPYLVTRTIDDAGTADALAARLQDEDGWQIALLLGGDLAAVMLHQPASIDIKGERCDYTAVELIAGPFGPRTLDVLQRMRYGRVQQVASLSRKAMTAIYAGEVGSHQLLGDAKHPGLVRITEGAPDIDLGEALEGMPEPERRIADAGGAGLPRQLAPLARWWPMLEESERSALTMLLDPFLDTVARRRRE